MDYAASLSPASVGPPPRHIPPGAIGDKSVQRRSSTSCHRVCHATVRSLPHRTLSHSPLAAPQGLTGRSLCHRGSRVTDAARRSIRRGAPSRTTVSLPSLPSRTTGGFPSPGAVHHGRPIDRSASHRCRSRARAAPHRSTAPLELRSARVRQDARAPRWARRH